MEELLHTENWKNESVSLKQLQLNLRELESRSSYPAHWRLFLDFITNNKFESLIDIGCGVGAYARLIKDNFIDIKYTGIDYSQVAIEIAKKQWDFGHFECKDYKELTAEYLQKFDLVLLGAFLDVLPDGNQALEFILDRKPKNVLISRIEITKNPSHFTVYSAYDTIETYSYKHNQKELVLIFEKMGYDFEFLGNNVYLRKSS